MGQHQGFVPDFSLLARKRGLTSIERLRRRVFGRTNQSIATEFQKVRSSSRPHLAYLEQRWYRMFGEAGFVLAQDRVLLLLMSRYSCGIYKIEAFDMYLYFYPGDDNISEIIDFFSRNNDYKAAVKISETVSFLYRGSGNRKIAEVIINALCGSDIGIDMANEILSES